MDEQGRKLRAAGFEPAIFGAVNLALFTQDKIPTAIKERKSPRQARGSLIVCKEYTLEKPVFAGW